MSFLETTPLYLNFVMKNLLYNPINFMNDVSTDIKKDKKSQVYNSKNKFVWICGLPKSGTTLVEDILEILPYIKIDKSILRSFPNKYKINDTNLERYILSFPKNKFSFVKTHLEYNEKIKNGLLKNNFKIIVTFRDIRDALISRYYHVVSDKNHWQHEVVKDLNFEEGFIKSLTEKTRKFPAKHFDEPIKYYFNWIHNWKKIEDNKNIKKIWYENYIQNPSFFIKEILKFTDFQDFKESDIEFKLKLKRNIEKNIPLIKKLKRPGKNVSTFRSGKPKQWKVLFTDKINNAFNKLLPGKIEDILN